MERGFQHKTGFRNGEARHFLFKERGLDYEDESGKETAVW